MSEKKDNKVAFTVRIDWRLRDALKDFIRIKEKQHIKTSERAEIEEAIGRYLHGGAATLAPAESELLSLFRQMPEPRQQQILKDARRFAGSPASVGAEESAKMG